MNSNVLKCVALLIALFAPIQSHAETFGGIDENTAPPAVIVPQTTAAPQTPPNPPAPIGVNSLSSFAPLFQSRQFYRTGSRGR
jgi:hypothetical protein